MFLGTDETRGNAAMPYRTVVLWVKALREGRDSTQDNLRTGRPHVENNIFQLLASPLDADRRWTACELSAEVGVCQRTVLQILHDILDFRKRISHEISEV